MDLNSETENAQKKAPIPTHAISDFEGNAPFSKDASESGIRPFLLADDVEEEVEGEKKNNP